MSVFERRLTFVTEPGSRPWLVADPGSEHVVVSDDQVSHAVDSLAVDLGTIRGGDARTAADQHGVFEPADPVWCGTREVALAYVCQEIADIVRPIEPTSDLSKWSWWEKLVRCRDWLRAKRLAGRPSSFNYTVALFGEGAGILVQTTSVGWPYRFGENCFVLDEDCAVHHFIAWSR